MLLSMTGFGEGRAQRDGLTVTVEMRTINSRYLKISTRAPEGYASLEPQVEAMLRKQVRRGTLQVNVRIDRRRRPDDYRVNREVLDSYRQQLESMQREWAMATVVSLEGLLALPGVVDEDNAARRDAADNWPLVSEAVEAALHNMERMRAAEGQAMADDMAANCAEIGDSLTRVERRAPSVVDAYRARLEERVKKALAEFDITLNAADLIREVSLFADRSDISEEIVRLRCHIEQFVKTLSAEESSGRKLEFLSQEMFRETNTIGSKANDIEIAHEVVEMKGAIERIREMVQNVE